MNARTPINLRAADLFAGLGGSSAGAESAGAAVVVAANHSPAAVATHTLNHPAALHVCQDLHQADFGTWPKHDLGMASPSCVGHTSARGGERAHHDAARSTALAVIEYARVCRPEVLIVENVPAFRRWSSDPHKRDGGLYRWWCDGLTVLGYSRAEHVINAADLGVPMHRERLFIVAARSLAPLRLTLPTLPRVGCMDCIEWDMGRWDFWEPGKRRRPPLSPATLAQIRAGRLEHGERFLVPYFGSAKATAHTTSLLDPMGSIGTVDTFGVVDGDRFRMVSAREYANAMGFAPSYILPARKVDAVKGVGNAVCPPVMAALVRAVRGVA